MALPRLTGALRSFSNVTRKNDILEESSDLKRKKSKIKELHCRSSVTWKKVQQFVQDNTEKKELQTINEDLKAVFLGAKQIGIEDMFEYEGRDEDAGVYMVNELAVEQQCLE
ncbi:activating signal cointegrator 1 complex subunit 3-like [Protopterus annectens]|uniref:activating signal cointegrator 1 complex subunit 3-like n=1 Tax=Protopterus annectens TaxID=7888 RepID=UPI001CFBAF06|nr:activating signal cointegrator 1 complex subunit 3-like [Protopterus annectens]